MCRECYLPLTEEGIVFNYVLNVLGLFQLDCIINNNKKPCSFKSNQLTTNNSPQTVLNLGDELFNLKLMPNSNKSSNFMCVCLRLV